MEVVRVQAVRQEQTTILCKVCRKSIAVKQGNTTNLFQHLLRVQETSARNASTLTLHGGAPVRRFRCERGVREADASSSHKALAKKQITLAAYYIAKDMVPIYTVERNGFIKMLQTMDPKYQLPSRKYFVLQLHCPIYIIKQELASQSSFKTRFIIPPLPIYGPAEPHTLNPHVSSQRQ